MKEVEYQQLTRRQMDMPAGLEKAYVTMIFHARRACMANDDMARMKREGVSKRCRDYQDAKHDSSDHENQLRGMAQALELAGLTECGGELYVQALKDARETIRG